MRKALAAFALVVVSAAVMIAFSMGRSTAAGGGPKSYHAVLMTGSQEYVSGDPNKGPAGGDGMGLAHIVLNDDKTVCVNMTVTGLDGGDITNSHIHGPARAGTRAASLFTLGIPETGVWRNVCSPGPLTSAQIDQLNTGKLYINVHTQGFLNGEVRGQIFK